MRQPRQYLVSVLRWASICCANLSALMVTVPFVYAGQAAPGPIPVVVGTVVERKVATEVEVVGTIEPQLSTTLSAEISGLIQRFDVREGDRVQQGKTIVAQLKGTDLELSLAEAEAELARAKAELMKLKRGLRPEEIDAKRAEVQERKAWMEKYAKDVERAKSLAHRDMVSISEYNLAESTHLAAKAQYEQSTKTLRVAELGYRQEEIAAAEAEVLRLQTKAQRLREDVQKTVIRAPVSGFITQRYTEVGQWLERGGKVADIVNLTSVLVRVPVHERDIRHVQVGDEAVVHLDALPGGTFTGRVKHIIPQADLSSRTFPVKIEVPNTAETAIKAGMFARVTLRAAVAQSSLMVPKDAVVRRGADQVIFVVQDSQAHLIPVKTGRSHAGLIELVESPVKSGDTVVVTGNETLQDRAAIAIQSALRN
jgi:HlyD family secretion protein